VWYAKDILATPQRPCAWMLDGFMSVDTTLGAGRAFLRSLYEQYAAWGVDLGNGTTNLLLQQFIMSSTTIMMILNL
jgi:hypothetical protein